MAAGAFEGGRPVHPARSQGDGRRDPSLPVAGLERVVARGPPCPDRGRARGRASAECPAADPGDGAKRPRVLFALPGTLPQRGGRALRIRAGGGEDARDRRRLPAGRDASLRRVEESDRNRDAHGRRVHCRKHRGGDRRLHRRRLRRGGTGVRPPGRRRGAGRDRARGRRRFRSHLFAHRRRRQLSGSLRRALFGRLGGRSRNPGGPDDRLRAGSRDRSGLVSIGNRNRFLGRAGRQRGV